MPEQLLLEKGKTNAQSEARGESKDIHHVLRQRGEQGRDEYAASRSELLTIRQVADLLHIHANTVRRWSDLGVLKAWRVGPRGDRRYRIEDINTIIWPD